MSSIFKSSAPETPEIFDTIISKTKHLLNERQEANRFNKSREDDEHLLRIIRLLVRPYQSELLSRLFLTKGDDLGGARAAPDFKNLWFDPGELETPSGQKLYESTHPKSIPPMEVDLAVDPILAWPWRQGRLDGALASMGLNRHMGPWKFDPSNHDVMMIMPIRVGIVCGGNHSIAAGILTGGGTLPSRHSIDLKDIYPHVACDGRNYIQVANGKPIAPVTNFVFAAVFEIGRLMLEEARDDDNLA